MQAVLSQITALETTLTAEKSKSRRNLMIMAGAYAVLIAWTIWDTSHVFEQIKDVSAPDKVARLAGSQVSQQLPGLQRDLVAHLQQTSPQIAARILQSAHKAIPETGQQIKQRLSTAADQLVVGMDLRTPELTAFLKANLKDSIPTAQYASDEELSQALVSATVKALDMELNQALNPSLFNALFNIKGDVDQLLGKSAIDLTAQQQAEKAALLNALRITELAQAGKDSSLLAEGLRAILQSVLPGDMFQALDSPVQH